MSCPEIGQVCNVSTPTFREGSFDSLKKRRRRGSITRSASSGTVTLNVYATKVCLRFASPSPPPIFPSPPYSDKGAVQWPSKVLLYDALCGFMA